MRTCPLCKGNKASTYMKPGAWNNRHKVELKKCKKCRFVFSGAFLCDYVSAKNVYADKTKADLIALANKERLPLLMNEIINKAQLKKGNVLDFGCGIGLLALCLAEKGFKTYAIETSQDCLSKHKEFNIISSNSLASLDVQQGSFDLIIMKDVLEHVDNPTELLSEILSYLKPSGHFYIRVPNVYHYPFHWSIDTKSHVNHFSPKQLMHLLEKNNMQQVDFIGIYDISTRVGKLYNAVFWRARHVLPMYHQISLLYQKR